MVFHPQHSKSGILGFVPGWLPSPTSMFRSRSRESLMAGKEDEFVQRRQSSSQVARDGIRSGSDSDSVLAECGKRISADADRNQQKPPAHRTKIA